MEMGVSNPCGNGKASFKLTPLTRRFIMKKLFAIILMALVAMWFNPVLAARSGNGKDFQGKHTKSKGKLGKFISHQKKFKCKKGNGGKYNFLNPVGIPGPIDVQGLAPRLDTIEGKTIYVIVCEAGPQTGPFLYQYLVDNYPDTNWVHIQHNGFGPSTPDPEVLENAEAVIGGQSW